MSTRVAFGSVNNPSILSKLSFVDRAASLITDDIFPNMTSWFPSSITGIE